MSYAIRRLRAQIADDAYLMTFQSVGQYRTHLLAFADALTNAAKAPRIYVRDDAETFAQALIASGWHNDSLACVDSLHAVLHGFLSTYRCEAHT